MHIIIIFTKKRLVVAARTCMWDLNVYGKNDFAERFKILTGYRSEN